MDYFSLGIFIGSYIYYSLMQILTTQQATPRARCLLRDDTLPVYYISLEQSANPSVHQFPCENNKELTKSVKEHGTVVNILVNFQKNVLIAVTIRDTVTTTMPLAKKPCPPFSVKMLSSLQNCLRGEIRDISKGD